MVPGGNLDVAVNPATDDAAPEPVFLDGSGQPIDSICVNRIDDKIPIRVGLE
jgi:hypothetical protein